MNSEQKIHLVINQQKQGPFSQDEIRQMYAAGKVHYSTLAWSKELPNWTELGKVSGILPEDATTPIPSGDVPPPIPTQNSPAVSIDFNQLWGKSKAFLENESNYTTILIATTAIGIATGFITEALDSGRAWYAIDSFKAFIHLVTALVCAAATGMGSYFVFLYIRKNLPNLWIAWAAGVVDVWIFLRFIL